VHAPIVDRINAERIVLLSWSRAILLQMSHPLVAAGVVAHSSFQAGAVASVRRLHQTVRAMLALAFGTDAERASAIADIRAIHRRVHGTLKESVGLFPAGTPYSAEDPALLLWVHATVVESSVIAYQTLIGDVTVAERDAYCRAAADVAVELGARREDVPLDWTALERYITAMLESGTLVVGRDGRVVAHEVIGGKVPRFAGPVGWINRLLTAGWLPKSIRDQYGLRWTPRDQRRFDWIAKASRRLRRGLPSRIALWPEAR
jgi:uncharacterized protein (DUF2236 family)